MSEMHPVSRNEYGDNEIDLTAIVKTIWRGRWRITAMAVAASLLALSFNAARWLTPGDRIEYSIVIELPFRNADEGNYPNGTPFSISDLVAANVLQVVYERLELQTYGMEYQEFSEQVGVKPEAITQDFISKRFKAKLAQKDLTNTEIEALEAEYAATLKRSSNRFARISVTLQDDVPIPVNVIERVLHEIPAVWSDISINQRGVLDIPVTSAGVFIVNGLEYEEYAITLEKIRRYALQILENIKVLSNVPIATLAIDSETGTSLSDLRQKVDDFLYFQLEPLRLEVNEKGIVRDEETTKLFFDATLREINGKKDEVIRKAELYRSALDQMTALQNSSGAALVGQNGGVTAPATTEFLDRVLGIGSQLAEVELKQHLLNKRIALLVEAEEYSTKSNEIQRRLEAFGRRDNWRELNDGVVKNIEVKLAETIIRFKQLKIIYSALLDAVRNSTTLSHANLYRPISTNMQIIGEATVTMKFFMLVLLISAFAGMMVGIALHLLICVVRTESTDETGLELTLRASGRNIESITR